MTSTQLILVCNDAHKLAVLRALLLEFNVARALREQGVITTDTDIDACMETRAALTNQNVAGNNFLPTKHFDAQSLGMAVAPVAAGALSFFMSHF